MKLNIVIDGLSAEELCAVGPRDLVTNFLPRGLGVREGDVCCVAFREVDTENPLGEVVVHADNYYRAEDEA